MVAVALLLLICSLVLPVSVQIQGNPPKSDIVVSCPAPGRAVTTTIGPGSWVEIVSEERMREPYLPYVRLSDLLKRISGSPYLSIREFAGVFKAGQVIGITPVGFLIDSSPPSGPGVISVCLKPRASKWMIDNAVSQAERFMP